MRLPQAVLFDMDGTLVDTEPLWLQAVAAAAAELGIELTEGEADGIRGCSGSHAATLLQHRVTAAELEEQFIRLVGAEPVILPGAVALLTFLKRNSVQTALVTASPRALADTVLAALGRDLFDASVAAGETANTKPFPDPYLAAAAALDVPAAACVAVEDSAIGAASATAAGVPVIALDATLAISDVTPELLAEVSRMHTVGLLLHELDLLAGTPYGGEAIDQRAHALQSATLAESAGGDDSLVAAALLHDLGYARSLRALRPGVAHEDSAAAYLRPLLGDRVADLVGSHVLAKRVLVTLRPEYIELLSPASVSSLRAQGGPAPAELVEATVREPWWPDALRLRQFDDLAKVPDLVTPAGSHFRPVLERLASQA